MNEKIIELTNKSNRNTLFDIPYLAQANENIIRNANMNSSSVPKKYSTNIFLKSNAFINSAEMF